VIDVAWPSLGRDVTQLAPAPDAFTTRKRNLSEIGFLGPQSTIANSSLWFWHEGLELCSQTMRMRASRTNDQIVRTARHHSPVRSDHLVMFGYLERRYLDPPLVVLELAFILRRTICAS
jgi:hypothetical protein